MARSLLLQFRRVLPLLCSRVQMSEETWLPGVPVIGIDFEAVTSALSVPNLVTRLQTSCLNSEIEDGTKVQSTMKSSATMRDLELGKHPSLSFAQQLLARGDADLKKNRQP
jgi:hypothetical protein